ncbi:hypothetical protein BY458DRAFT_551006 [Sporodiniella umbellata]|nr:hypothetical protein BY458DRAFT_551006 [Sporodiniella umbellata]
MSKAKGMKPSQMNRKPVKEPLINRIPKKGDDIPEEEKMRMLDQTGLLQKVKKREEEIKEQNVTTTEHVFMAMFMSFPFAVLFATFDVVVKVQYSEEWNYTAMALKVAKIAPVLVPFIYITNRYRADRTTQVLMTIVAAFAGSFLMFTIKNTPSLGQMMRAPGLATTWIYLIIQLDLLPASLSLGVVALYWYLTGGIKLF